ncbi:hypothetical protein KIW84_012887 [Lathyrus oleraceus]|uniref:Uncharacterized protein n=1 Tax=Pisum sativum TaxID=3888 RepID=A0A9D5BIR5_PEA|nr:hypothetical protein KIW84_012887 [Pisum sativum]
MLDIEWQATLPFYGKEKEKLREFKSKYNIKEAILKREQEARLQPLEAKQLEARQKFSELSAPDELSNLVSLKELGTSHNAPKILLSNEVSETSCKQATASELSRKEAVGLPSKVRSTDYPDNAAPLNSLSIYQISDEGYEVVSSTPCIFSSPGDGRPTTSSLFVLPSKQQVPDRVLLPITDGQILVVVPENNHEEAECQLTDDVEVNESTASDYQEVVDITKTENTLATANPVDSIHQMQFVLQGQHPGSTGNLVHGPTFIFSPVHYQASVVGASNNSPYATIVHNNGYSFPIPTTSLAATAAIKGASPSQTTHMQSGPLHSSQTFQPFQDPQQHPHSQALLQPNFFPSFEKHLAITPHLQYTLISIVVRASSIEALHGRAKPPPEAPKVEGRYLSHALDPFQHYEKRKRGAQKWIGVVLMPCRGLDQAQIELVLHLPVMNAPPGLGSEAVGPPGANPNRFCLKRPMLC